MGCDERVNYGADLARSGECTKNGTMVRAMSANRECFQPKDKT